MVSHKKRKVQEPSPEEELLAAPQAKEMAYEQAYLQQIYPTRRKQNLYFPSAPIMKPAQEPFRMTTPYKVQTGLYGFQPQLASFTSSRALKEQEQYQEKEKQLQEQLKESGFDKFSEQALPYAATVVAPPAAVATVKGGVRTAKYTGSKLADLAETASKWVKGSSQAAAASSQEAGTLGAAEGVAEQSGIEMTSVIKNAAADMASEGATSAPAAAVGEEAATTAATSLGEEAAAATAAAATTEASLGSLALTIGAPLLLAVGLGIWATVAILRKKKRQKQAEQGQKEIEQEKNAPRPIVHELTPKEQEQATQTALGPR